MTQTGPTKPDDAAETEVASLPDAFLRVVQAAPDKPLLYFEGETYSYAQVHEQVSFVAGALAAYGLTKGDRVALYLENSPSFITAYLGVQWLGGVVVPVNTRYRFTELRHMLTDSSARIVLTDAAGLAEVEKVREDTPVVKAVVKLGENLTSDRATWADLADGEPRSEPVSLTRDDLAVIGYTSGTTGRSKGAVLTHGNFVSNSVALTKAWVWMPDDHLLLVLPLFHMHGLGVGLHGTLVQGSALTLRRKFDAADVFNTMLQGEVTMFFGVPTMYTRLLEVAQTRDEKPTGLRLLVSGSAPLSPQIHAEVEEVFGLRILERYGMTETVMNMGNPYDGERRAGSVGVPFEGIEARVADSQTGEVLATGETGEIQIRGPNLMKGYWNHPDATAEAWTGDGWFKTGDLGFVDVDGYYTLNGRAKELVISGGFNVYPREVEEVLAEVVGVREVAVLGLPDADLDEKVVAAVVGEVSEAELLEHVKTRIAGFKKPKEVYFVAALPRNALGKVQKHVLREQLLKGKK